MSYSRFRGEPVVTETTYEYDDDGRVISSVATSDPDWSELDRGLLLALLAERAETCPSCGHLMSVCRDKSTAGTWQAIRDVCQPTVVAQVEMDNAASEKRRGVIVSTRRTPGL